MQLITARVSPSAVVVSFAQDNLDAGNVQEFRDAIQPVMAGHEIVLIDMSALQFVDSSGLGALLACLRSMNGKSGQLRLFALNKPVRSLFELVRMHRIFSIYERREDAVEDLA